MPAAAVAALANRVADGQVVDKSAGDTVEETVAASGLRVVRVEGDARARGRRAGELLGDLVDRSLAF